MSKQYQTIENFGASDAWSCQFVGRWPDAKRTAIADLLFSLETTSIGQPSGIGLSLWRFNLGAGSAQQGDNSGITDEWRRAESFIGKNDEYEWDLQAGQMWFLKAAKDRGVEKFLAFCNSPLVSLTKNGKAFATAGQPNLATENFDAFADYLVNVVKGVKNKIGVTFDYLSPANEPQWDWGGGQEGTPFTNEDITGIVTALDAAITREQIPTKITIVEAGQYNFLYSAHGKPRRGNQIDAFFTPGPTFIGDLPSVEQVIVGHGYFTTSPYNAAVQVRRKLHHKVKQVNGLRLWQSEYCILGDNNGEINGNHRDLGIKPAIYLARVIHNDLVNANASAWHWWTAISAYDYKDGLIYVDKNKTDGNFEASKMLWALGNFSRFIRPGAVRVSTAMSNQSDVLSSAFVNKTGELVVVLINPTLKTKEVKLNLTGATFQSATAYVTSSSTDLYPFAISNSAGPMQLEALSITTVVSKLTLPSAYRCCLL